MTDRRPLNRFKIEIDGPGALDYWFRVRYYSVKSRKSSVMVGTDRTFDRALRDCERFIKDCLKADDELT